MRLLVLALALVAVPARPQTAHLAGRVTDARTGEALPGANVFLSGTVRGSATDADGAFAFTTDVLGDVEVVASLLGYDARTAPLSLAPGDTLRLSLSLVPSTSVLGEARVEGRVSREWRSALALFEDLFFGDSPNGRRARLETPEVLDFDRDGDRLSATTRAPLVVYNEALGYRMTLLNLRFRSDDDGWGWKSPLRYEDLPTATSEAVQSRREETYRGSLRHFLAALVVGRTHEEGFRVRHARSPGFRARGAPMTPEGLQALVTPDTSRAGWQVTTATPLQVHYVREHDPRPGVREREQISWITLDALSVRVDGRGRTLDGRPVTRYGYWDWERAADLLPDDYDPQPSL